MDNFFKLLSDFRSLLIGGGLALFTLSLVGQITPYTPVMPLGAQILGCIVGFGLMLTGIWLYIKDLRKDVRGIRILSPVDGEDTQETITVRGEIKDDIPEGKELWLLRIYPDRSSFVPMKAVHPRSDKTWEAESCNIAGKPKQKRIIGAYIVDRSAAVFLRYFCDENTLHGDWMNLRKIPDADKRWLQPIKGNPAKIENMKMGHEVEVRRI